MCNQFFRPRATGRMEFSARLVLSSNSGHSKKRVSFFHSASAYWQALLSALEGKAADCAASILAWISSVFNNERPHEALGMKCPAEIYQPSTRPYQGLPDIDYPLHDKTIESGPQEN